MRRPLLFTAYYLFVTPYGLVRRFVRDPLSRRWDPKATTYLVRTDRRS
jgi:hypothetical protein